MKTFNKVFFTMLLFLTSIVVFFSGGYYLGSHILNSGKPVVLLLSYLLSVGLISGLITIVVESEE